ncbi:hypothetical protein TNCV_2130211 [Trichonephila clavipes]|nr:hypothetical protein TNCV_2130211 [Trichonephila clavipes]
MVSKSHRFFFCLSKQKKSEIRNAVKDDVDLAIKIFFEMDSEDVRKLLDSHNQELTIDELIEMRKQEQVMGELAC